MTIKFNLTTVGDVQHVTAFIDGEMYTATEEHPNWKSIAAKLIDRDESVIDLFDISQTVARKFDNLTERVSVANGRVYYDNDEVNGAIADMIIRFIDEDVEDWVPLANFLEKVQLNPNQHSRDQLYTWITGRNITIGEDGDIIAYKGVQLIDGKHFSIHAGTAIVDGQEITGYIPNEIGSVITMPRAEVQHDPAVGCHKGIHAGTWDYARSFSRGAVLEVKINPKDVVSVPTDCSAQKMRTCRIEIIDIKDAPVNDVVYKSKLVDYYGDDDDEDYFDNW